MVQVVKRTMDFELFLRRNPGTVRVSTENSKAEVILNRCAILGPATALFRFMANVRKLHYSSTSEANSAPSSAIRRVGCCSER